MDLEPHQNVAKTLSPKKASFICTHHAHSIYYTYLLSMFVWLCKWWMCTHDSGMNSLLCIFNLILWQFYWYARVNIKRYLIISLQFSTFCQCDIRYILHIFRAQRDNITKKKMSRATEEQKRWKKLLVLIRFRRRLESHYWK